MNKYIVEGTIPFSYVVEAEDALSAEEQAIAKARTHAKVPQATTRELTEYDLIVNCYNNGIMHCWDASDHITPVWVMPSILLAHLKMGDRITVWGYKTGDYVRPIIVEFDDDEIE